MNESGHFGVDSFLFNRALGLWIVLHVATVKDTDGVLRLVLLGHSRSLLIGMLCRVLYETSSVCDRVINFRGGNDVLLRTSVAQDRSALMKEVQNSVMDAPVSHSQFVNVVAQ